MCCIDGMLDTSQKLIDPFFSRGRHQDCDVHYLSKSYFDLPKRTSLKNFNVIILFQQTLKDVEHSFRDIFDKLILTCPMTSLNYCAGRHEKENLTIY